MALRAQIEQMHQSWVYWVTAAWRKTSLAQDARSPSVTLAQAMTALADRWQRQFDEVAPEMARRFTKASGKHTDTAMAAAFKRKGLTVAFRPTRVSMDAYRSVAQENVNLIKSIASEYLTDVQGDVWRAVQAGYDLKTLHQTLQHRYDLTNKRAALIARDQSGKANAAIEQARREELGITEAIWLHSAGGKEPRPSHVAASGKLFKIADGLMLDGKMTKPGLEINCRCVSRAVIPGF